MFLRFGLKSGRKRPVNHCHHHGGRSQEKARGKGKETEWEKEAERREREALCGVGLRQHYTNARGVDIFISQGRR